MLNLILEMKRFLQNKTIKYIASYDFDSNKSENRVNALSSTNKINYILLATLKIHIPCPALPLPANIILVPLETYPNL